VIAGDPSHFQLKEAPHEPSKPCGSRQFRVLSMMGQVTARQHQAAVNDELSGRTRSGTRAGLMSEVGRTSDEAATVYQGLTHSVKTLSVRCISWKQLAMGADPAWCHSLMASAQRKQHF
jgi:hypothetical protein